MAKVEPESISYVETHGTGTPLGDPIEIEGLKSAFNTREKHFCRIGSVKTNIGHLDSAAGIAGFIKTVLALNHGLIPPSLHFKTPNPEIDFENSPFIVNTKLTEWKRGTYPLRAGVSSFGIGGTNAHVVLEEWPDGHSSNAERRAQSAEREYRLILLSARTKSALEKMTANLVNHFIGPIKPINPFLANAAYTLQVGRKSFPHRKMLVCSTLDEAIDALSSPDSQKVSTSLLKEENSPVLFMFPGQGAQYVDMALGLYQTEPLFRQEMDRCFDLLKPIMGCDLKEILYPAHAGSEEINRTEVTQPVIFAVEYALARLLISWGIKPYAMIGHSIGEYTAACLAGVFSLEDALTLVALRGKLMQQMPAGGMLSVPLPEEQLTPLLQSNEELSLAAVNSPSNCVISGPQEAVDGFALQLKEKGHQSRPLHTSHAFHSKMMEPILTVFEEKVKQVSRHQPQIPYLSNVTGRWTAGEEVIDPGYWASHIRNTVRFFDGLTELLKMEGKVVLVEVGPGRVLSTFVRQHPDKTPHHLPVTLVRHPGEKIPDDKYLLSKIGTLWLYGASIDWQAFNAGEMRQRISLPTYPFERQPYPVAGDPFFTHEAKALPANVPLVKKADIADWFYTPAWKEIHLPRYDKPSMPPRAAWLVFAHEDDLCRRLEKELEKQEQRVIVARQGKAFIKKNNGEFILDPAQEGDYEALFNELRTMDLLPGRILHLWQVTPAENNPLSFDKVEESLSTGFFSLLAIARSLGKLNVSPQPQVQIDVVTSHMQEVTGEELLCPAKAALLGPVKVIPMEYPNIRCRSIDIVLSKGQEEKMVNHLLAEVSHEAPSPSAVVAYRRHHRWVQVFEPVRLPKHTGTIPRLKQGGVYLVTGGLGGMGLELAHYLAKTVKAKLVLTEPFDFPTPGTWDQWLDTHPIENSTGEKIRKIRELEKGGAEVWVARADAANMEQMKTVVEETGKRFGPINGVIHTAGVPDGRLIHLRTRPFDEEIMAPKVKGTLVLDALLNHQPLDFFFICSSLDAVTGDIGLAGYTAANCFLDAFASYKALTGPPASLTVSINWDAWQQVGMAAGTVGKDENRLTHTVHLRPNSHWVLGEHKVNGTPTLVGTAYLEMAAAAFESLVGRNRDIEISDLYYLTPLTAADRPGEDKEIEVRTILEKEEDHWEFSITSRGNPFEDQWQVHARGKIAAAVSGTSRIHNVRDIREQCREYPQDRGAQSELITVGARWDNIKETRFGENRGVARLELPGEFDGDMERHKLHPALMDTATAFLIDHTDQQQAYLPFFFKRVRIKGALPTNLSSYARLKEKGSAQKQALAFDVTITDDTGVELVDIEEMTVLAVSQVPGDKNAAADAATASPNPADPLKNAILPHEGVEVFTRVLADHLHRVAVSTVDLSLRREKEKNKKTPRQESSSQPTHPRPELTTPYAAPGTKTQQVLADIWQEYLGIREIGIHDDFFELGADSLKALTVITRIHKKLNVEISITDIFTTSTIAKLGEFIEGTKESIYTSIAPLEEKEYYPLSSAQMRLYLHQQMQAENLFYNLPFVYIVEGPLDMHRLERAYQVLIQRHESLRTSFELIDDEPVQRVHRAVDFRIKYHDAQRIEQSEPFNMHHTSTIKHFVRPFDLACAPLMRAEVVQIEKEKCLWLFDIHHIIADATGYAVLQKDLVTLYDNEKEKLPPLKAQYKDFSDWQNRLIRGGKIKGQEKYWLNIYSDSGDIPRLNMPTDFPRPERLRFEGGRSYFKLGTEETLKLRELGSHAGATLFVNLLTLLNVLLFKYTGQSRNDLLGITKSSENHQPQGI
jgi:acyl transferase domain-containing protein